MKNCVLKLADKTDRWQYNLEAQISDDGKEISITQHPEEPAVMLKKDFLKAISFAIENNFITLEEIQQQFNDKQLQMADPDFAEKLKAEKND